MPPLKAAFWQRREEPVKVLRFALTAVAALMIDFLAQQNIAPEFNDKMAPALGVSYGGKIALLPGQSKAEEFVSLVHETAHELLHKAERRTIPASSTKPEKQYLLSPPSVQVIVEM